MAGNTLMSLLVKLGVDSEALDSGLSGAEKKAGTFGGTAKKAIGGAMVAAGAMAIGAIAAVGAGLASCIGPASDLSETVSKIKVVFGDAAGTLENFGETASYNLGMSENAALTAAGTYGNLFRAMGMTTETSAEMSMGLVTLAGDLASFNNMNPEEVLDKLRAGLTGETEPLKSLGVNLNAAMIEAKALSMGLMESTVDLNAVELATAKVNEAQKAYTKSLAANGPESIKTLEAADKVSKAENALEKALEGSTGELTASAKAAASYALIMEQTSLAQGDFARTAGGLANQQRILSANITNLKAGIGTALLPTVLSVISPLNDFAGGLTDIINGTGTFEEKMSGITESLGFLVKDLAKMLPGIIKAAFGLMQGIVTGLIEAIPMLMPAVIEIVFSLVDYLVKTIPMLIDAGFKIILMLIMGIAQALPKLIPSVVEMVIKIVMTLLDNLPMLIKAALELVMGLARGIITALPILVKAVPEIVITIIDVITENLPLVIDCAIELITTIMEALIDNLPLIIDAAIKIVNALLTGIVDNLPVIINGALKIITTLAEELIRLVPTLIQSGKDLVAGIWEGLQSAWAGLKASLGTLIAGLPDWVKKLLGIGSPSKVTAKIGISFAEGLGVGFEKGFGIVEKRIGALMGGLSATINAKPLGSGGGRDSHDVYNMNINSSAPTSDFLQDFSILKAWAGS